MNRLQVFKFTSKNAFGFWSPALFFKILSRFYTVKGKNRLDLSLRNYLNTSSIKVTKPALKQRNQVQSNYVVHLVWYSILQNIFFNSK